MSKAGKLENFGKAGSWNKFYYLEIFEKLELLFKK